MTKPRVLISDQMDPKAEQIFRERGCDVDVITGKTPEELKAIIGEYDGLAIRLDHEADQRADRSGDQSRRLLAAPALASTISISPPHR